MRNNVGSFPLQAHGDVLMMDALGSYPTNNARVLSPFAKRDCRAPFLRPTGCVHNAHRVIEELHECSHALLMTMDAIVKLFEFAHHGEDCSEEDSDTIAMMVKEAVQPYGEWLLASWQLISFAH